MSIQTSSMFQDNPPKNICSWSEGQEIKSSSSDASGYQGDTKTGAGQSLDQDSIDQLISNLNGKLTLQPKPTTCHSQCKRQRISPYSTNGHVVDCNNYHLLSQSDLDDLSRSVEASNNEACIIMQQLIKEGNLIKEAVRRLQFLNSVT